MRYISFNVQITSVKINGKQKIVHSLLNLKWSYHANVYKTYAHLKQNQIVDLEVSLHILSPLSTSMHQRDHHKPSVGITKPISSVPLLPRYLPLSKHWLPIEYRMHILNCRRSSAAVAPVKYGRDLKNLTGLTEKLTSGALATSTPKWFPLACQNISQFQLRMAALLWGESTGGSLPMVKKYGPLIVLFF